MPESISTRPAPALLALALTSAGAALTFRESSRKLGRGLLAGAIASAVFFYAWPARGEAPFATVLRALVSLPDLPSARFQVGVVLLVFIILWPLMVALLGVVFLRSVPRREEPWLSVLATFGFPALLFMFAYRALVFAQAGLALLAYSFTILVVLGILALVGSALVVAGQAASLAPSELSAAFAAADEARGGAKKERRGLSPRASAIVAAATFLALSVVEWVLARPPKKGVEWSLAGATEEADHLYGPLFSEWDRARRVWDAEVRREASASGHLEVRRSAKDLVDAAKKVDPGVADALVALTSESDDLDLAGRRFFRLIEDVNEASRRARLPYYVDPTVALRESKDGIRRLFYASTFRIDSVNRWDVGGRELATLVVHPVSGGRASHGLLGFSRDAQPFALVDVDEIEPYRKELEEAHARGACSTQVSPPYDAEKAWAACGDLLSSLVEGAGTGLGDALVTGTERHELQHQIDGPHLPMSGAVLGRLGAYVPSFQDRVNRELSAYVAELTADGLAPKLELVHLAQFVLGEPAGAYHHTAVLAFEALSGRTLRRGVEPEGKVDYDAFADVLTELGRLDDAALRRSAERAYRKLYNVDLAAPRRLR
jgi:hypothetical protein